DIKANEIKNHIYYLASDNLEGRFTGSNGADSAANYIKNYFQHYGLLSFQKNNYFQEFPFVASVELTSNNLLKIKSNNKIITAKLNEEYIPTPFSGNVSSTGQLAFVGYGISTPNLNYDDYDGVDVTGKIVVIMRYNPDEGNPHSQFEKYTSYRYKAKIAKEKGAVGVIFVNGYSPKDDEDKLMKLTYDGASGIDSLGAVQVKRSMIDNLFKNENLNFQEYQKVIDKNKKPASFIFKNFTAKLNTGIKEIIKYGKNVVGYLEGKDPVLKNQYIVIGAHYDHLGYGEVGSLYRGKEPKIHYGADDNASGTAGVLELAEKFSANKDLLKRSLIFITFSGEEIGALGSSYFADHLPVPINEVPTMINLDMIGRLNNENNLIVYGTGTSSGWKELLNKDNSNFNFKLTFNDEGYAPSDQSSFYAKKIPVLFFFTGTHSDYHRPSDTPDKINYPGEESILNYVYSLAYQIDTLSNKPDYINVPRKDSGKNITFRVYVGTVPDYAGQVDGLKINGVNEGSPAQKGGLKGGDIIIGFGGKKISNIYDYTYALGDFTPGDIVDVVVMREGQKVNLKVELGAR
ncbi:MAG: M28 family peptidase, partial [Bacteroidetes bacterium]|nr:M28 family peptidase [Bacteroidota bacterium]